MFKPGREKDWLVGSEVGGSWGEQGKFWKPIACRLFGGEKKGCESELLLISLAEERMNVYTNVHVC